MELKEFLYVDVDRVRSLLSQIAGGFIEQIRTSSGSDMSAEAQAVIFGVGAKGDYSKSTQYEEARSLQDLTFVAFERLANENGYIVELGDSILDPNKWESGAAQSQLVPGQLARIECDVQLLDGSFFGSRVERFKHLRESLVKMQTPSSFPKGTPAAVRKAAVEAVKREIIGELETAQLDAIAGATQSFVGDSVLVRLLTCGEAHMEYGFMGALLGRKEYIQEERENLFSRYGQAPARWTTVFQIAAIPPPSTGNEIYTPEQTLDASGHFNRANLEKSIAGLLGHFEQLGLVEGPRWPSVSVTPLGIYRTVPKAT